MAKFPLVFVHTDIIILIFVCLYAFLGGGGGSIHYLFCIIIVCILKVRNLYIINYYGI